MSIDPNTPVIVGVAQVGGRGEAEPTPLGLMAEASRKAFDDSGAAEALRSKIGSVGCPDIFSWPGVTDPARLLAAELGLDGAESVATGVGGTSPHALLADACTRIGSGAVEAVLISGGEAVNPFMGAMKEGRDAGFGTEPEGTTPDRLIAENPAEPSHPKELEAALVAPISYYPLFEHRIRAEAGRSREEHQRHIGQVWARVGAPARTNPHAWTPDVPDDPAAPTGSNRVVMDPYTKLLTANIQVDQGAALVLCSVAAADAAGVPADRRIYPRSVALAHDHWFAAERERLDRSPAIAACLGKALPHAGVDADELTHLDLYSCFPSAVQIACAELGIDPLADSRGLSVTGGLTFAGGPANNYCSHSLATMTGALRTQGGIGLVTAVGWYMTKHGAAVLSAEPPERPFGAFNPQDEVDAGSRREVAEDPSGTAPIETFTVAFERDGTPTVAVATAIMGDGTRAVCKSDDPGTLAAMASGDPIGAEAELAGGTFSL